MSPRRAITPPSGSVQVPKVASLKAPADMTPTVPPPAAARRKALEAARETLIVNTRAIEGALRATGYHPLELTSVIGAIDHLLIRS
jgi:hypothetical protein